VEVEFPVVIACDVHPNHISNPFLLPVILVAISTPITDLILTYLVDKPRNQSIKASDNLGRDLVQHGFVYRERKRLAHLSHLASGIFAVIREDLVSTPQADVVDRLD
jgi:hypothetical protein